MAYEDLNGVEELKKIFEINNRVKISKKCSFYFVFLVKALL